MAKRRWGRWLAGGIVAVVVLYFAAGTWFVHQVLNRLLVVGNVADLASAGQAPSSDPYELTFRGDPQAAFQLPFETVSVATALGPAEAWLIPPAGPAKGTWAVFVHGIAGVREGGYRYLPALYAAGYPVLMITYRNDQAAPRSAEGIYSFGLTEWPDIDAAIDFADGRGAADILLIGDSMGGAMVGQFLGHSAKTGRLRAIILDSPALDYPLVVATIVQQLGWPFAPVLATLGTMTFAAEHGVSMADAHSIETVAAYKGPLLVVHGTGDRIVPIGITDRLLAQRQGVTTRLRTHADHLASRQENPALYDWTLRTFLTSLEEAPR